MHSHSTSIRISVLFAALFSVGAVLTPFFPLFLQHRGLSGGEIGTVLASMTLTRLAIGPLGALADRSGDRRPIFLAYLGLVGLSALLFLKVDGFAGLLIACVLTTIFWNPLSSIVEAVAAMHAARGAGDFGRMRAWGSAAFVVVTVAAGWFLNGRSPEWILGLMGLGLVAAIVAGCFLPPLHRTASIGLGRRVRYGDLLTIPGLVPALAAAALVQGSHQMFYGFSAIYWKAQGFGDGWIGLYWSVAVLAETAMFAWSAKISTRVSPWQWLLLGAGAAVLRWTLFPFVTTAPGWIALQLLHSLTFGATHIGIVLFIARSVRERQSVSAQSLYGSISALAATAVSFIAGPLYAAAGGIGFAWMVLPGLAAVAITLFWRPGHGEGGI